MDDKIIYKRERQMTDQRRGKGLRGGDVDCD